MSEQNIYNEINRVQDIIEERHKVINEIRKLSEALGTKSSEEVEKEIIKLLEKTSGLRQTMQKSLEAIEKHSDPSIKEYVVTLIDFIRLVDMDEEEQVFSELVGYARRTRGPLYTKMDWLEREMKEMTGLSEKLKHRK